MSVALTPHDLALNWCALAVSILANQYTPPEMAFAMIDRNLPVFDAQELIEMKKTMTYKQIGELLGLKPEQVRKRIRMKKARDRHALLSL